MPKDRRLKPRPLHPFPHLAAGRIAPKHVDRDELRQHSPAQQRVVRLLQSGARMLFDITAKRGLIYSFRRGLEHIMEITSRMLSALLGSGEVVAVARQGTMVHYAWSGADASWYRPE